MEKVINIFYIKHHHEAYRQTIIVRCTARAVKCDGVNEQFVWSFVWKVNKYPGDKMSSYVCVAKNRID